MRALTRAEVICAATRQLLAAGIDAPRREARLLLAHALGLSQEALLAAPLAPVGETDFPALLARRCAHEPLAFILGEREFWSLSFEVSPATLIPRPESETLIEAALAVFPDRSVPRAVLDLGTGTGCLLLAALSEFSAAFGIGVDRSEAAARLARRNAVRLGLASRAAFLCADWAAPLAARFDLILCNPPYIARSDIAALMPEVAAHEPLSALDGGVDGLDAYRMLVPVLPGLLRPGGAAVIELGAGQKPAVAGLAAAMGLAVSVRDDLSGIPRAVVLTGALP
ncbi:MAG TPA: peptide chain release factor N(5)-glutamine methyltransferase [Acetobacteraceae bacterium]|nr:peptide chain release factor N(5)-glutamine methyltransferase [Acetobacteraceae bacterium]